MTTEPRPLETWEKRLAFLQEQEAIASDPAQKFTLREQIEEAQGRIRDLLNTSPDPGHKPSDPDHKPKVGEGLAPSREGGGHPHLDLGRLPIPGPHFVGREADLARLDAAWVDPSIHVLTFVAFGGVGKSALVAHWLDRMAADNWRGVARVLDWSFYSQGLENRVTSAEPFIDHALRFFGDPDPNAGSIYDRGSRLASLIRSERSLLILDGIEPLQYPPGRPEIEGRLKDPGLTALLKGLAVGNPGLCIVTTRERIADLADNPKTAPQIALEELEPDAAVSLLRQLGVVGRGSEVRVAVEEFKRHALTLTLLGNYLRRSHDGDIRKRREIGLDRASETQGGHAFRVIAAYARSLGEGPELAILRLLGLFDRPAEAGPLKALRAAPPIPGLTEPLFKKKGRGKKEALSQEDWKSAVTTLRDHGLRRLSFRRTGGPPAGTHTENIHHGLRMGRRKSPPRAPGQGEASRERRALAQRSGDHRVDPGRRSADVPPHRGGLLQEGVAQWRRGHPFRHRDAGGRAHRLLDFASRRPGERRRDQRDDTRPPRSLGTGLRLRRRPGAHPVCVRGPRSAHAPLGGHGRQHRLPAHAHESRLPRSRPHPPPLLEARRLPGRGDVGAGTRVILPWQEILFGPGGAAAHSPGFQPWEGAITPANPGINP